MATPKDAHPHAAGAAFVLWMAAALVAFSLTLSVAAWAISTPPDVVTKSWTRAAIAKRAHAAHPPRR